MRIRIWEPRSRIKLFLSIELSGALSRLRLRNLSLSDGGFRLSSQATTARSSFSYCASVPVNRRTPNSSQRDRMQNIVLPHFPSSISTLFLKAEVQTRVINSAPTHHIFYMLYNKFIVTFDYELIVLYTCTLSDKDSFRSSSEMNVGVGIFVLKTLRSHETTIYSAKKIIFILAATLLLTGVYMFIKC